MKQLSDAITFRHGATIKNRMIQTAMLTNSGVNEMVTENTLNYYNARSNSCGMVIVEYTNASINGGPSRSWPGHEQLAIYDDKFIPGLTEVAKTLKKDGNKALLQLCHAGREAEYGVSLGRRLEVPSIVDYPWIKVPLYEMTDEDIRQVIKDFGSATKRAIECGSKDFIVGYRISPEEVHRENIGYTWHECQKLVEKLTGMFDFDYIHFSLPALQQCPLKCVRIFSALIPPPTVQSQDLVRIWKYAEYQLPPASMDGATTPPHKVVVQKSFRLLPQKHLLNFHRLLNPYFLQQFPTAYTPSQNQ